MLLLETNLSVSLSSGEEIPYGSLWVKSRRDSIPTQLSEGGRPSLEYDTRHIKGQRGPALKNGITSTSRSSRPE